MRRTVRLFAAVGPVERLGRAIAAIPAPVQRTLAQVARRTDLRLASGSWEDGSGGCLVANAVACVGDPTDRRTLDLRMLDAFPQMSSRDLNTLIVAWDEAAAQADVDDDAGLRALLHAGLLWAEVPVADPDPVVDPDPANLDPGGDPASAPATT
jgi:hypothetical protein